MHIMYLIDVLKTCFDLDIGFE